MSAAGIVNPRKSGHQFLVDFVVVRNTILMLFSGVALCWIRFENADGVVCTAVVEVMQRNQYQTRR
jgi:hypothetical protein